MQDMLFGDKPSFDEVMDSLRKLEKLINAWYKYQIVDDGGPTLDRVWKQIFNASMIRQQFIIWRVRKEYK
jgi:hypothetical protein